jgi:galactokinase
MPYPDWVITLKDKDEQKIHCRLTGTSSGGCYVVVLGSGDVETIPKESVLKINYDPTIN